MKKLCLAGLLCLFSIPATVFGCSCATPPPSSAFNDARVVFIGRMLGGTHKMSLKDQAGKPFVKESGEVRFAVEEVFKGSQTEQITIQIDSNEGTSCGPYGLIRGERYVVYAYGTRSDDKLLYTGVCTRTGNVTNEYTKEDLDFLHNLPPQGVGGEIQGHLWADLKNANNGKPLADVRVKISGPDEQTITVFSDKNGNFKVKQLKPGKYKVEPQFPPNYTSENKSAEVNVDDRGVAMVGFEAYIDGKVSGRVIDKDGNTFNAAVLEMAGSGNKVSGFSTGEDGGFEIEGVPPGEYVLYLELQHRDYSKTRLYYYPGTFEREKASAIRLGLGERIESLEFRLPDEYRVITVEGQVSWADGTPAANVEVLLLCPRSTKPDGFVVEFSPASTNTDEQGRFRLEGFTGATYWLEARGERAGKKDGETIGMHSQTRKLSPDGDLKNVKLKLSQPGRYGDGCPEQ